jgi:SGNH hydrolase-like domain, acetyltransferase AlgX
MPSSRTVRTVFAVLAAAFFATPLALLVVGVRARAFENRALRAAPKLADGWAFFDEATRYLIDRLPLRYQAVHANSWIYLHIFAATPSYGLNGVGGVTADQALPFTGSPDQDKVALVAGASAGSPVRLSAAPPPTAQQVVVGRLGWLFLQGVFDRACAPFIPFSEAAARWESLVKVIKESGRNVELVVAPDKNTIYPEYVAPGTPNLACGRAGTAALWRVIESRTAVRNGVMGLRKPLLADKARSRALLYYRTDSHWNGVGSLTFIESLLPALGSTIRVLPSEILPFGTMRYSGDLLGLLGASGSEIAPTTGIRRRPGAPVVPGTSIVIGDSYADVAMSEVAPYFASINLLEWAEQSPQQIADGIAASRNVVLETVEREFDWRASDVAYITPRFIALVRATLAKHHLGATGRASR